MADDLSSEEVKFLNKSSLKSKVCSETSVERSSNHIIIYMHVFVFNIQQELKGLNPNLEKENKQFVETELKKNYGVDRAAAICKLIESQYEDVLEAQLIPIHVRQSLAIR